MWADGGELVPVGIGFADRVKRFIDLLAVEPFVLQALEGPLKIVLASIANCVQER